MDKSPKPGRAVRRSPQQQQGDDGGRGTETTVSSGSTIVPDTKGGTGNQGDDGDPKHPGSKPYA